MSSPKIYPTMAAAIAAAQHTAVAPLTWNPTEHLLSRCSFGATPYTRSWVGSHGPDAWYAQQVKYGSAYSGYRGNSHVAALGPLLELDPYDLQQTLMMEGSQYAWTAMDQLTQVTLGLQGWSPAQLYEVLVDFFSNHLNVQNHNGELWSTRHTHDRDVVRKYAMGSFTDMLLASCNNPAMLTYLNLAQSTKTAVNENYGREVLEMHTVGLNYSQNDVVNCARMLTGRTMDGNFHYLYDDYIHWTGPIKVLGFTHANNSATGGEAAGNALLRYLASHPDTARHLAQKLCIRLVSDAPSADLVNAVAAAYLAGGTQILPMVSTILRSAEFWQSRGRKVRRPLENVMSTIRTLGVGVSDWAKATETLHWMTGEVGQCPLDWAFPNGYPDLATSWRSSGALLSLWDIHLGMAGGWNGGLTAPDPTTLYGSATTSGQAVAAVAQRLTNTTWSADALATLQTFLNEPASTPLLRSVLRWQLVPIVALVLDAPHHALR